MIDIDRAYTEEEKEYMRMTIINEFYRMYDEIEPDLPRREVRKKADEFIESQGGIESILNKKNILDIAFENVENAFEENKNTEYFEKKKCIEPLLKEFFQTLKENMTAEDMIIYKEYINKIIYLSREGTQYPFWDEIGKEEQDGQPVFLKAIVKEVREEACSKSSFFHKRCMDCQELFNKKIKGVSNIEKNISFDTQELGLPVNQHVFNIIQYDGKYYLIDPSYIQFCRIGISQDVIGVPNMTAGEPGMYLMNSQKQIEFLKEFIRNGFFEINNENIKMYMDSLVLSNRNANYYLNHPDASKIETEYIGEDYIKLLIEVKLICFGKEEELGKYIPTRSIVDLVKESLPEVDNRLVNEASSIGEKILANSLEAIKGKRKDD